MLIVKLHLAQEIHYMDKITKTIKFDLFKEEHEKCKDHNCEFEYLEAR
jgi:hypothetical protein